MSWGRLQNPNELFKVGDTIQVKVLKFDRERERVSLGYKQLLPDPWSSVEERFPIGSESTGALRALPITVRSSSSSLVSKDWCMFPR